MIRQSSFFVTLLLGTALFACPDVSFGKDADKSQKTGLSGNMAINLPGVDLPAYQAPESYSVDLVMQYADGEMVLKRFIDKGRVRTEINASGENFIMIEMNDEKGTMYTLMPEQKRATKTSLAMMEEMAGKQAESAAEAEPVVPETKIEDLGDEEMDGQAVKKLRMTSTEGVALGWFNRETGAPVRLESTVDGKETAMNWTNYTVAPQPEKLFQIPSDYEVTDMEQAMAQMKGMGMGSMAGNLAGGMAGGMAQNFGQSMGSSLGASLGGALGGPVGAIAGQYIGGKVGGMIGKKAASAVLPGQ
jgi:hypothetical protein